MLKKRATITIYSLILIFIFNLFLILLIHRNWDNSMGRFLPLKVHIGEISDDLIVGHLWLEEAISGDRNINIEQLVWARYQSILDRNQEYLQQNSSLFRTPEDREILSILTDLQNPLQALFKLAKVRYANPLTHRPGSPLDEKFDVDFMEVRSRLEAAKEKISQRMENEIKLRQSFFKLSVSIFLLLNIPVLIFVYLHKKSKDTYEKNLQKLRNLLSNVINSMPSTLVAVNQEGHVIQWNRQAEKETGISSAKALDKSLSEVFPELANEMSTIHLAIKERTPKIHSRVQAGNVEHFSDVTIYPLLTNGIEGAVIRVDDVTERVRMEEMMVQTEKMLSIGGLAAGMAHEINNPLSIISQAAQNATRRLSTTLPANQKIADELGIDLQKMQEYLEKREIPRFLGNIETAVNRSSEIIKNMLNFSATNASQREICSITAIIQESLTLAHSDYDLKNKHDFRNITIETNLPEDLPQISINRIEIQQVIFNLIKNASQAMNDVGRDNYQPKITIAASVDQDNLTLKLMDNGPGMPAIIKARIFEPFYTTKEVGVGTGLGLSVSYFIVVKRHQGQFKVESEEGKGTTFTITLPRGN